MGESSKWLAVGFIVVVCSVLLNFSGGSKISSDHDKQVERETPYSFSKGTDDMPESSNYTYGIKEYQVLNDVVSEGMVIKRYQRIFKNTLRKDYDIEAAYVDFARDMEEYKTHLRNNIADLKAMRPAQEQTRYEQANALKKLEEFYSKLSEYPGRSGNIKDTLKFLDECEYELGKLHQEQKLPKE